MTTLTELKAEAKELGLSDDYIKTFGTRSKKATYEAAIAKFKFEQETKPKSDNTAFIDKLQKLTTQKDILEAVETYLKKIRDNSPTDAAYKTYCSRLNKDIKETIKQYPDDLARPYGEYVNYCAVTFILEINKAIKPVIKEQIAEDSKPAFKEVVVYDFEKVVTEAVKNLASEDWRILAGAVAFLTGRRPSEVCCISRFEAVTDNQMTVSNIAKKREGKRVLLQIPVLANADDIQSAVEKIRQLKPMHDVLEIYKNDGDSAARKHFNSHYAAGEHGLNAVFNREMSHLVQASDKKSFGATRNFYSSAVYWICKTHFKTSNKDAIGFAKSCLGHESEATTMIYQDLDFINLPQVDDQFFNNIGDKEMTDLTMALNITELAEFITPDEQIELKKSLAKFPESIEKALIDWKRQTRTIVETKTVTETIYKTKESKKDKIADIIQAMINHNEKLMVDKSILETEKLYITISRGSLDTMCQSILETKQPPQTLKTIIDMYADKITECNEKWNKAGTLEEIKYRANNLHIRPVRKGNGIDSVKMDIVKTSVSNEYNALQMQDM